MVRIFSLLLVSMFVAGCQTTEPQIPRVVSEVTIFHEFTPDAGDAVFVTGAHDIMNSSLEFKSYRQQIENKLVENGVSTVSEESAAQYIAVVNYGIDDGTTTTQITSTPIFGQTGGGSTTHSGSVYSAGGLSSYSGTSYTYPTYGIVGSSTSSYDITTYKRVLTLDIFSRPKDLNSTNYTKVWEGKLNSVGTCGNINEVIDELIAAMFTNFPGVSGTTETIEITYAQFRC